MKIKKIVAAAGVALTLGIASQAANAVIELKHDARGDALLFPLVVGLNGFENYYAISNSAPEWIQGHIRFRGAAWCGELLDFDVILSPGDVFVFRIADIDGDGEWEIDQTLDKHNFQYTGLLEVEGQGDLGLTTSTCTSAADGSTRHGCMDPNYALIPEAELLAAGVSEGHIAHQKNIVHFEFIAESVLNGMNDTMMAILLSGTPGLWAPYQTDVFSNRGTSAWKWSNAANNFATYPATANDDVWLGDRGLRDVGNWLSGVGFISTVGMGMGVAYNADALVNFRTEVNQHRVENYRVDTSGNTLDVDVNGNPMSTNPNYPTASPTRNRAVIVHDENGAGPSFGAPPFGDYLYRFLDNPRATNEENSDAYESRISFTNTWGPTLADGDDYDMTRCAGDRGIGNVYGTKKPTDAANPATLTDVNLRWTAGTLCDRFAASCGVSSNQIDDWDARTLNASSDIAISLSTNQGVDSIAEVEEAIRVGGQNFGGYYFDDAAPGPDHRSSHSFQTWFAAWAPTKFYYGEDVRRPSFGCGDPSYPNDITDYEVRAITSLLRANPKTFMVNVWDIDETPLCGGTSTFTEGNDCISPFTAEQCAASTTITEKNCQRVCGEELCVFPVSYLKGITTGLADVSSFRVGRTEMHPTNNDPVSSACGLSFCQRDDYPTLIYNFDNSGSEFSNWRRMVRN
jgi:hypothetical protein